MQVKYTLCTCTCDGIVYNLYRLAAPCLIAGKSAESDEVLVIDSADVTLTRKDSARLRVREFNEPFDISNSDSHTNFSNKQANALDGFR